MFVFNDGGRAAAGFKGKTGDCSVRAISIALNLDYKTIYKTLAAENARIGGKRSVRRGAPKWIIEDILNRHGWVWHSAPKIPGRKARCSDLSGTVIARQSRHVVAVIDGVPHDTFDSSNKMVYGYWVKA